MFTEFGADAFNARDNEESQYSQAYYMLGNWKEIYENAAGLGKAENSLGGFTFQFSDGWWKFGQTKGLDVHDNNASWGNGGYLNDFAEDQNNMNEEWFGICAKGSPNTNGLYQLFPRAAYYALQEAHNIDPYAAGMTAESIGAHFMTIELMDAVLKARGDKAALDAEKIQKVRISGMRAEFTTFSTGGTGYQRLKTLLRVNGNIRISLALIIWSRFILRYRHNQPKASVQMSHSTFSEMLRKTRLMKFFMRTGAGRRKLTLKTAM